jgi:hypothetical protein
MYGHPYYRQPEPWEYYAYPYGFDAPVELRGYGSDPQALVGRGGREPDGSTASTFLKVGIVLGGALMIYAIYRGTKAAAPIHEAVGGAAVKILAARGGKLGGKGAALSEGLRALGSSSSSSSRPQRIFTAPRGEVEVLRALPAHGDEG